MPVSKKIYLCFYKNKPFIVLVNYALHEVERLLVKLITSGKPMLYMGFKQLTLDFFIK